uniref:Uncharacterized protein n=1 Tax=Setaria italica TaxID=4555 RepID=K4AP88_SETIT
MTTLICSCSCWLRCITVFLESVMLLVVSAHYISPSLCSTNPYFQ